ncbi:MAG TPA: hypothetical protein VJ227_00690 [Patescibacteria group bacterium]|nr:hypothetical protein [Patescibacteria group bacterium]
MPPKDQPSPFDITTTAKTKKGGGKGLIVGILIMIFLILSVVAGILLVRQRQGIAERAAVAVCPQDEACPVPDKPKLLISCTPTEGGNNPTESICDLAGEVEVCGNRNYCCPAPGQAWTTNMTVCNALAATPTPSPSPTPTVTPTPTATPVAGACNAACTTNSNCAGGNVCSSGFCRNPLCTSAVNCSCVTATATPTALASAAAAQSTPLPIPATGIDFPTFAGIGVGVFAIILSILIAL